VLSVQSLRDAVVEDLGGNLVRLNFSIVSTPGVPVLAPDLQKDGIAKLKNSTSPFAANITIKANNFTAKGTR